MAFLHCIDVAMWRAFFFHCSLTLSVSAFSSLRPNVLGRRVPAVASRRRRTINTQLHLQQQEQQQEEQQQNHELYWLDEFEEQDDDQMPLGQSFADGEVVLCLPRVATEEECESLFAAAQRAVALREEPPARGRSRMSVSDPEDFGDTDVVMKCEQILLRVMDYMDAHVTSIYDTLFWPKSETWCEWQPLNAAGAEHTVPPLPELADQCKNLRELYMAGELEWSEGK